MTSFILLALVYTLIAGVMNGSFALPTKHIKPWSFENIWLQYAFWAFLVIPWVLIFVLDPHIGQVYAMTPVYSWVILLLGGFLFGVGQVCFALALNTIGLGLGFVLNIGLGTGLGFLLPLVTLHPEQIVSSFGAITLLGILFIIIGLLLSYYAGQQRDAQKQVFTAPQATTQNIPQEINKSNYHLGVWLAIIAGVFSAGQNFTFALTSNMQQLALASGSNSLAAAIVIWPAFLLAAFIPYAAYMIYLHKKNHSFQYYQQPRFVRNALLAIIMAIFWYGSLAIYSKSALMIGDLGPVVAWPLFMVLIILTSNFWGWRHKEWQGCSTDIKRNALLSVMALIVAVIILAYSATLSH